MKQDLLEISAKMQMDVNALAAKLTELRSWIASLPDDGPAHRCERCRSVFRGPLSLAEHLYIAHDGPVPSHWEDAEERSAA